MSYMNRVRKLAAVALVAALAGGTAACDLDDIMDVDRPGVLTTDELAGPAAIPLTISGIVGDFTEMIDGNTLYTGLFTDEFILGGTFPTRHEVDSRSIDNENASIRSDMLEQLNTVRFSTDNARELFTEVLADPGEGIDVDEVREGLAFARYFGGYARLLLAEAYCEASIAIGPYNTSNELIGGDPVRGGGPGAAEEVSDDLSALELFELAEDLADEIGIDDLRQAAIVGQARAHMWMGDHDLAAADAQRVDDNFVFSAEYSTNAPQQFNEVAGWTWTAAGFTSTARWTVGWDNNNFGARRGEVWPYFEEWVDLGLITVDADVPLFDTSVPAANAPNIYRQMDAPIVVASGREARLYEAEAALRNGAVGTAEGIVNSLRADWGLGSISLTGGDLSNWADDMAREYAREMWLNSHRQHVLRRFATEGANSPSDLRVSPTASGVDLYPPAQAQLLADGITTVSGIPFPQICFPTEGNELDNNPHDSHFGTETS